MAHPTIDILLKACDYPRGERCRGRETFVKHEQDFRCPLVVIGDGQRVSVGMDEESKYEDTGEHSPHHRIDNAILLRLTTAV